MTRRFVKGLTPFLVLILLTVLLFSACGQASEPIVEEQDTQPEDVEEVQEAEESEEVAEPPEEAEAVELLWWDTYLEGENPARVQVVEKAIADFEQANPNVTIRREPQDFENMKTLIRTALASGTGPDAFVFAPGAGFMGPLVEAELLLPLNEYQQEFGWADRIYPSTWDSVTFDGQVYAIGHELEMIGVYYNPEIFAELGVEVPTTLEELVAIAEEAQAAGYIPIAFQDQEGWTAYHMFSVFANNLAGKDGMDAAFAGDKPWNDPEFVEAIQTPFVEFNEAGYYVSSPLAISYQDANTLFHTGEAAMLMTGMWLLDDVVTNAEFDAGFFAMPAPEGKETLPPGGMGSAVMISAATEHPDIAAAFVDYFYSQELAADWYESRTIPVVDVAPPEGELDPLFQFFIETIRESLSGDGAGLGYNIDVLTPPEFNSAMLSGFQAVLAGEKTPEEVADELETAYNEYLEGQN